MPPIEIEGINIPQVLNPEFTKIKIENTIIDVTHIEQGGIVTFNVEKDKTITIKIEDKEIKFTGT